MKNIAPSLDETVLAVVRRYAAERGGSVNALVRDYLIGPALRQDRAHRREVTGPSRVAWALIVSSIPTSWFMPRPEAAAEEAKRKRALELIDNEDFGLSAQLLQEFYVTVTRKIERRLSAERALKWMEQLEAFPLPRNRQSHFYC